MTGPYIPVWMREAIIRRAGGCCEYCRTPAAYSPEIFEFEHPRPRPGQTVPELDNLAWSCPACNRHKATRTTAADPQTGEVVPLFNPRTDRWPEHFGWSADLLAVEVLRMNRAAVVRFRLALKTVGQHPAQILEE